LSKLKIIVDVMNTMKQKEVVSGIFKAVGTKDQVEIGHFNNEFEKNLANGETKIKLSAEFDCDGKKLKHESQSEFTMQGCCRHKHHGFMKHMHQMHHHTSQIGGQNQGEHKCCGIKGKLTRFAFMLNVLNQIKVDEKEDKSVVLSLNLKEIPEELKKLLHEKMSQHTKLENHPHHGFMKEVIIVDLMLPGKDGYEITQEIRAKFEIPVIIVSAKNEDIDKIRGLGFGADDYLTKPFSPAELVARVKAHILRYERLKGKIVACEVISHRGLEINTASHKVFVNGKEIQLTTTEYGLLVFFASNPNMVFSKDHIFETLWGDEPLGDTATVAVHVQKIRKKIERDPSNPEYIETLWGAGYRFNA